MKKSVFFSTLTVLLLTASTGNAQSWKDIFNKENIEKAVGAVTGKEQTAADLNGTWSYTGAAVEFESDNLLAKAGGVVASTTAEEKLNEQLGKLGIAAGKMTFTFNTDSTFTAAVGTRSIKGTYTYAAADKKVNLQFMNGLIRATSYVTCTSGTLDALFDADKVLAIVTFLAGKTNNSTLQTISSLASNYDGMRLGFSFSKKNK
ncbi:MAG: DUF4923 family protein [Prevotellaceae bacterium]|jgi:hypothetical protein|nr:DUF4923 family protein [Prevotellaceae bacterium]